MEQLRDIKPIVAIPDNSLTYLMIVVAIVLLVLLFVARLIWRKIKNTSKDNGRKIALNALKNLDFSNSKATAYIFEHYGNILLNEHNLSQFEQIRTALVQYKYKKQVGDLDVALVEQIKRFVDA